jgi:hypothetical protein
MARVQPPGKKPGRRRWLRRLLGACLAAAVLSWPAAQASAATSGPPAPTGLSAAAAGPAQINLTWTAPVASNWTLTQYEIYAGTSSHGESPVPIASPSAADGTGYQVPELASGTTYYFDVVAVYQNCSECSVSYSAPSTEAFATTNFPMPGAPTGLIAAAAGTSGIRLSWTAPASPAGAPVTDYRIYYGTRSGAEALEGNSTTTSDPVLDLHSGTTYYFEVTAVNSAGESARSGEAFATTTRPAHVRASQVIQFGPLARHVVGVQFTVAASATSRLPVSLLSDTPGVCSVSERQVATITPGRCTITASQGGDARYAPAQNRTRSFRVMPVVGRRRHRQSITFARPANEAARRPVKLSASASSRLPVSFRSDTPGVCSVSGRQVTIIKPGTCTITATQGGNAHYRPAADKTRSFQIEPVPPQPPQAPRALVIVLGPIVLAAILLAAAAGALLRRRYRRPRGSPRPSVRAEPHPDSPGTVRLRVTGPDVRGTVRIEPHQSYVYSRVERAQS